VGKVMCNKCGKKSKKGNSNPAKAVEKSTGLAAGFSNGNDVAVLLTVAAAVIGIYAALNRI
jgi:hypothetical protein